MLNYQLQILLYNLALSYSMPNLLSLHSRHHQKYISYKNTWCTKEKTTYQWLHRTGYCKPHSVFYSRISNPSTINRKPKHIITEASFTKCKIVLHGFVALILYIYILNYWLTLQLPHRGNCYRFICQLTPTDYKKHLSILGLLKIICICLHGNKYI